MEDVHTRYRYRPLDPQTKEIRLLRIVKTGPRNPITLELRHAKVDESGGFYALSYCWGEDNPVHRVPIHDGSEHGAVFVRVNLFHCLKFAHETTQDWSLDWIWIDQICIDQDKHKERCHQVGLMGELYTSANATVVWPGIPPMTGCTHGI